MAVSSGPFRYLRAAKDGRREIARRAHERHDHGLPTVGDGWDVDDRAAALKGRALDGRQAGLLVAPLSFIF